MYNIHSHNGTNSMALLIFTLLRSRAVMLDTVYKPFVCLVFHRIAYPHILTISNENCFAVHKSKRNIETLAESNRKSCRKLFYFRNRRNRKRAQARKGARMERDKTKVELYIIHMYALYNRDNMKVEIK